MPHDPDIPKDIGIFRPGRESAQFVSRKQGKGLHKISTTGGSSEHRYGTLPENLKSYTSSGKLQQIYAAGIFLHGEDDHSEFWETVEALRAAGAFPSHMTNQFIWDNYIGNPQSWRVVQSILEGMEAGSGLQAVEWETRSLRGGQTTITGRSGVSPEQEQKRLELLQYMLDVGKIDQETYDKRVGRFSGAGSQTKSFPQGPRKRFPDDPVGGPTTWEPSGPDSPLI